MMKIESATHIAGPTPKRPAPVSDQGIPLALTQDTTDVFHGSSLQFEKVIPYNSPRSDPDGTIIFNKTSIFASADYRVALFYTYQHRQPGVSCGIDLRSFTPPSCPITYYIRGGENLDSALDTLYGHKGNDAETTGYIYSLDAKKFHWEKGLGVMECASADVSANQARKAIDRRQEIDRLVGDGSVSLQWSPA